MTTDDGIDHADELVSGLLTRLISVAESIRFILLFWTFASIIGGIVLVANR